MKNKLPKLKKINIKTKSGLNLKYRVTGAGLSKSDYTKKLDANSDLFMRKNIYKFKKKLNKD